MLVISAFFLNFFRKIVEKLYCTKKKTVKEVVVVVLVLYEKEVVVVLQKFTEKL